MARRTNASLVEAVLGANYGPLPDGTSPDLNQYIDTASMWVDDLVAQMRTEGIAAHDATRLEMIERWLAGWAYTKMDPTYSSKSTGGASGSFIGSPREPEAYKDVALSLDSSGCLPPILNRQRIKFFWMGKRPSEQIAYEDRN